MSIHVYNCADGCIRFRVYCTKKGRKNCYVGSYESYEEAYQVNEAHKGQPDKPDKANEVLRMAW